MNEVITKLYEIEEKAAHILDDAKTRKDELQKQLEQDKKSYDAQQQNVLKERVMRCKRELEAETQKELLQLEQNQEKQLAQLDEAYDEAHLPKLAEQIFRRMTEV